MPGAWECMTSDTLRPSEALDVMTGFLFFWILAWGAFSYYTRHRTDRARKCHAEYASRVVSIAHAVVAVINTSIVVYSRLGTPSTAPAVCREGLALTPSIAYFIVDTIGILASDYFDALFLLHHFGCVVGMGYVTYLDAIGFHSCCIVLSLEATNPFMHWRWLRQSDGHVDDTLYSLLTSAFIVGFFICRMIFGPMFLYVTIVDGLGFFPTVLGAAFFVFSAQTIYTIVRSQLRGDEWTC